MYVKCIDCEKKFSIPFSSKTFKIWQEICVQEGNEYKCLECLGLNILECDYIKVIKIFTGSLKGATNHDN